MDDTACKMLVQALALSPINYCSLIWGLANITQIQKVQKLQNFAARVAIGGIRKFDHVTPAFETLKWIKMSDTIIMNICIFIYKILHNHYPKWVLHFPTINEVTKSRSRQFPMIRYPYVEFEWSNL